MFSNTNTGIKLHLLLIIIIAGVAYFMYQLYSECKDLERELVIAKKQIALLTAHKNGIEIGEGDCLATLVCPIGGAACKPIPDVKKTDAKTITKSDKKTDADEELDEEIDIDEDDASVKSEYINKVMANVQKAHEEEEAKTAGKEEAPGSESESESESGSDDAEQEDESEEESEDDTDLSKLSKAELNKLKLSDLKDFLKSKKQTATGSKAELVARIQSLAAA